jgi:hypothetical protein
MPMREECKHYQSRTYASGEVTRFCVLDLAPEAPWRCPDDCPSYVRRLADAGWTHGSLVDSAVEAEPNEPGPDVVELLEDAVDIVNAVAPEAIAEAEKVRRAQGGSFLRRVLRRPKWRRRNR